MALTYGYTSTEVDDLPFLDFLYLAVAAEDYLKTKMRAGM